MNFDPHKPFVLIRPPRMGEKVLYNGCYFMADATGFTMTHDADRCVHEGKSGTVEQLAPADWPGNKKS